VFRHYKITQEFLHRETENNTNSQSALMHTCQYKEMNAYINVSALNKQSTSIITKVEFKKL